MLPIELWIIIFKFLNFQDKVVASRVSLLFHNLYVITTTSLDLAYNKTITDAAVSKLTGLTNLNLWDNQTVIMS